MGYLNHDIVKNILNQSILITNKNKRIKFEYKICDDISADISMIICPHRSTVGWFNLSIFPSCDNILISHNLYIYSNYRNQGIAQKLQEFKEKIAKKLYCDVLLCTYNSYKDPSQKHILEKHGWKTISNINKYVDLYIKHIK